MTQVSLPRGVLRKLLLQYSNEINDLLISLETKRSAEDTLIPVTIPFSRTIFQSDEYKNNLVYPQEQANSGYIYLIHIREFLTTGQNVYKIGRTQQKDLKRFKTYPNGSELLFHAKCNDCVKSEKYLIKLFTEHFLLREDLGNEYFQGELSDMLRELHRFMLEASPVNPGYSEPTPPFQSIQSSLSSQSSSSSSSTKKNNVGLTTEIIERLLNINDEMPEEPIKISSRVISLRNPKTKVSHSESEEPQTVNTTNIDEIRNQEYKAGIILDFCEKGDEKQLAAFLNYHKNLNLTIDYLQMALGVAIEHGHSHLVDQLLEAEGELNIRDENGMSFLDHACFGGSVNAVKLLLQYPQVEQNVSQVVSKQCPLVYACLGGSTEVLKLLLQYPTVTQSIPKVGPLFTACIEGHIQIVKLLLDYPEGRQGFFSDPIRPLFVACKKGFIEIVKLLLNYLDIFQVPFEVKVARIAAKGYPAILMLLSNYQ